MSAAPARCWWPGRTATTPRSGPPSTPAWCRPPRSTARRSSPPRGSAAPDALHPVQRELAARGGSQCGYCTPGFVCSMAAEFYRRGRAPDAAPDHEHGPNGFDLHALERQPVPLHRLPPDPGRRLGAGPAARRRPARGPPRPPRPGPGAHPARRAGRRVRPPGGPRRGARPARRAARTPPSSPAPPTGASRSTSAATRSAYTVAVDRLPELRGVSVGADLVEIGAALTLSEVERRSPVRCRCSTRCSRCSPPG